MIIKRMTATFGKLDRAELVLTPGLNVITAPNEFGKSTWAAFLLAMFYGVDSTERATKTNLPAKLKYKPWSGQAMEGRVEILWKGRGITLERTSQGRTPLGVFRAFDTDTGAPLEELREDTCGQILLGVPRSVFERSGFLRQQGLAVTGDAALESRLTALVTTGDETVSFSQTEKRLRELKNRRRHNKTGLLPQAEAELQDVEEALDAIHELGRRNMDAQARQDELTAQEASLRRNLAGIQAADMAQKRRQLDASRTDWEKKARCLAEKEPTVAGLGDLESLQDLLRQLDALLETAAALEADLRLGVAFPQEPTRPAVFAGLDPDAIRQKAEADCRSLGALPEPPKARPLFWSVAAALLLGGGVGMFFNPVVGLCLLAAGALTALGVLILGCSRRRMAAANTAARAAILAPYAARGEDELRREANDCREAALLYRQEFLRAQERQSALDTRQAAVLRRQEALLAAVHAYAPEAADLPGARAATLQAVHRRQFYAAAAREEAQSRAQYAAVRAAVGAVDASPLGPEAPPEAAGDAGQLSAQLEAVTHELLQLRSQLDRQRGRMPALGDPAVLEARKEELSDRIARLSAEYDALDLAMEALSRANDTLQTRFAPQLSALAAQYMARLTGGRYDKVLLRQDMAIDARQTGEVTSHPLLAVSAGTADQLFLAVRLAIVRLVLDPETPLILDDALVSFDDTRMAAALDLLQEQAQTRQVLLLSCQTREEAYVRANK